MPTKKDICHSDTSHCKRGRRKAANRGSESRAKPLIRAGAALSLPLLCLLEPSLPTCYLYPPSTGFHTYIYPRITQETAHFICPFSLLFQVKSVKANCEGCKSSPPVFSAPVINSIIAESCAGSSRCSGASTNSQWEVFLLSGLT